MLRMPIIPSVFNFSPESTISQLEHMLAGLQIDAVHFDEIDDLPKYYELLQKYHATADIHLLGNQPMEDLKKIINMKLAVPARVSVHVECCTDRAEFCVLASNNNITPGLAFRLPTPISADPAFYEGFKYVHLLCIDENSGILGFDETVYSKARKLRDILDDTFTVTIDAGVKEQHVHPASLSGISNMVMGSAIFKIHDPLSVVVSLNKALNCARSL